MIVKEVSKYEPTHFFFLVVYWTRFIKVYDKRTAYQWINENCELIRAIPNPTNVNSGPTATYARTFSHGITDF